MFTLIAIYLSAGLLVAASDLAYALRRGDVKRYGCAAGIAAFDMLAWPLTVKHVIADARHR